MKKKRNFKQGTVVIFDPESFNPDFWVNLKEADRIKYYSELGYGSPKVNYPPPKGSGLVNHRSHLHSFYYKPIDTWLVLQQLAVEEALFCCFP